MRRLTLKDIERFARRRSVKRIAVENFLMSMGENEEGARANLDLDLVLYHWNAATIKAIRDGIDYACEEAREPPSFLRT